MQSYPANLKTGGCTWQGRLHGLFVAFGVSIVQSLFDMCLDPFYGSYGQGSAIDSFSLNSSYFLAKGVPVLGALFNLGVAWHLWLTAETLGGRIKGCFASFAKVRVLDMFEMQDNVCSTGSPILYGMLPSIIADTLQGDGGFLLLGEVPREHRGLVHAASYLPGMEIRWPLPFGHRSGPILTTNIQSPE